MVPAVHIAADRHDSEGRGFCVGIMNSTRSARLGCSRVARDPERILIRRGGSVGVHLVQPT